MSRCARRIHVFVAISLTAVGVTAADRISNAGSVAVADTTGQLTPEQAKSKALALLDRVATAESEAARLDASAELADLGPTAIPVLVDFLSRARTSSDDDRRQVLSAISADIPDKDGRFASTRRSKKNKIRGGDDFDWLAALAALTDPPRGTGDVMADIAAIRALAGSGVIAGADGILDYAFSEVGLVYRDECGRYLRKMAPHSLPTLIRATGAQSKAAKRRYAGYQLERLDRKLPSKAIDHASIDENLEVAVIEAYGASKPREAVEPILATTNHTSPRVRTAARAAWMNYITGPEPPPAPKRKLKLAGGRLTDEPEPLWLTYRELAEVELRKTYEAVMGEKPARRASLQELTDALFGHYDQRRKSDLEHRFRDATAKADIGDWAAATAAFDRILAENPEHPARATMAPAFLTHAKSLEQAGQWRQAAAAYSKAYGLAPTDADAKRTLAAHHYALGKALESEGKDGTASLRRAASLDPDRSVTDDSGQGQSSLAPRQSGSSSWMLYVGLASCAGALLLVVLGFAARQRGRHGTR